jgi:poly(hydroxyalkanoate) depolymerase family esterase
MNSAFTLGMAKATQLTRSGKVQEATALIQSLLAGQADTQQTSLIAADDVIEGKFTRLDPTAAPDASSTPSPEAQPQGRAPGKTAPRARRGKVGSSLAETLQGLMANRTAAASKMSAVPDGAQFLSLTHASAHGSRDYRLYVPSYAGHGPMPLIVMLHGCTQGPEDFAEGTGMNILAEEFGFLVAYPAQGSANNMQKCWNWFRPEDQRRDAGEPAILAGIVRDIQRDHAGDPARTYVAGLSAGGATAALLAAAYPEVFAAAGVHSGLPVGAAQDLPSALSAMRSGTARPARGIGVPTIVFHGTADQTVHPQNGEAILAQALDNRAGTRKTVAKGVANGGRSWRSTAYHARTDSSHAEHWEVDGAGHAWSGGQPGGSYTDPKGPDASREMVRFFLQHRQSPS